MNFDVTRAADEEDVKKALPFSPINMKTKVVQHVLRIIFNVFKFSITFKLWNSWFPAPV